MPGPNAEHAARLAAAGFARRLLDWFRAAARPLPWRRDYHPYQVWISEIMLQQTQMERGVRYYREWMRRFPDVRAVAEAGADEILSAWEGLGYYSRARNLRAAARRIMERHGGVFPEEPEAVRALPGIGDYTAGAILSIAFNRPEPAVDANVLRIFSRLCDLEAPVSGRAAREGVAALVRALIPSGRARPFNQALMELGALICGKRPRCRDCPLADACLAFRRGTAAERPVKRAGTARRDLAMAAAVIVQDGRVLVRKRPEEGLWAGLWEFPGGPLEPGENPEAAARRHAREAAGRGAVLQEALGVVRHGYTVWRVTLHGFLFTATEAAAGVWVGRDEIGRYAFPAGHRKLLERLGWKRREEA